MKFFALVGQFCIPLFLKPCWSEITQSMLFYFYLSVNRQKQFHICCFSEIFLPSSNEESLVCRSSTDSLRETRAVHHLHLKSLLTRCIYLTAQLFLPWYPAICSMLTRMCSQYSRQAPRYSPFHLAPIRNPTPGEREGCNLRWDR